MQHRIDEGVITGPNVLDVVNEGVDVRQHLGAGGEPLPVEAVHAQPGGGVPAVLDVDQVLGVGPDSVLGPEQRRELEGARVAQGQGAVDQVGGDRGRVGDEAEAAALEAPRAREELVQAGADAHSTCRRVNRPVAAAPLAEWMVPVTVAPSSVPRKCLGRAPEHGAEPHHAFIVAEVLERNSHRDGACGGGHRAGQAIAVDADLEADRARRAAVLDGAFPGAGQGDPAGGAALVGPRVAQPADGVELVGRHRGHDAHPDAGASTAALGVGVQVEQHAGARRELDQAIRPEPLAEKAEVVVEQRRPVPGEGGRGDARPRDAVPAAREPLRVLGGDGEKGGPAGGDLRPAPSFTSTSTGRLAAACRRAFSCAATRAARSAVDAASARPESTSTGPISVPTTAWRSGSPPGAGTATKRGRKTSPEGRTTVNSKGAVRAPPMDTTAGSAVRDAEEPEGGHRGLDLPVAWPRARARRGTRTSRGCRRRAARSRTPDGHGGPGLAAGRRRRRSRGAGGRGRASPAAPSRARGSPPPAPACPRSPASRAP